MKIKPNPCYATFLAELKKFRGGFSRWEGLAFRAAPLEFARLAKLLDGQGSLKHGGRWAAAGTFRAVNLSTSKETALKESSANFTYYNFALSDVRPKVIVSVRLKLHRVVDLTNPHGAGGQTWLRLEELLAEDWRKVNGAGHESQSQALGRAAHDAGAEGLLVPSARSRGGVNIVYFPDPAVATSTVEILGEDELQRWLKKR